MTVAEGEEYRAEFDAVVTFSNGGELRAERFRVDVPDLDVDEDQVAALLTASLGLLMTERVVLQRLRIFPEPHKGTRGGPSDRTTQPEVTPRRLVELSHVIKDGLITYPGLPGPEITTHLTREASRAVYSEGTEFQIDRINMIGNTGTYLDSPYHRYEGGIDLSGLSLTSVVDLPTVVVRTAGSGARAVDVTALASFDVTAKAVLLHTGRDEHWGTPRYADGAPYLTKAGAHWLVENQARLVGIDSINIDDIADRARPAHSLLLAAGIPVVEHLTGLGQLPPYGARFSAAPPRVADVGTFPVRAYATVP